MILWAPNHIYSPSAWGQFDVLQNAEGPTSTWTDASVFSNQLSDDMRVATVANAVSNRSTACTGPYCTNGASIVYVSNKSAMKTPIVLFGYLCLAASATALAVTQLPANLDLTFNPEFKSCP